MAEGAWRGLEAPPGELGLTGRPSISGPPPCTPSVFQALPTHFLTHSLTHRDPHGLHPHGERDTEGFLWLWGLRGDAKLSVCAFSVWCVPGLFVVLYIKSSITSSGSDQVTRIDFPGLGQQSWGLRSELPKAESRGQVVSSFPLVSPPWGHSTP